MRSSTAEFVVWGRTSRLSPWRRLAQVATREAGQAFIARATAGTFLLLEPGQSPGSGGRLAPAARPATIAGPDGPEPGPARRGPADAPDVRTSG